jgi:hypothetical protein
LSAAHVTPSPTKSLLPSWTKGGSNATLFLHNMPKPRHGTLQLNENQEWILYPGKQTSTNGIPLPDLVANCQKLLYTGQLFRGHTKFCNVYDTCNQLSLQHCVLHHVTAHGRQSLIAPSSLKQHSKMSPSDKIIWDTAYNEEYDGLTSLPSWEVISEDEYNK